MIMTMKTPTTTMEKFLRTWNSPSHRLLVYTSGSTGVPKPIWVEKSKMLNSARITCDFLGLKPGNVALLCMSLDYIAGKMMVVRSIERQLCLIVEQPNGHPLSDEALLQDGSMALDTPIDFAAMVPMQVYNSLQVPKERERLARIKNLIIGGGAIDETLEAELRKMPNAIWSTYGMTETLSHIALRRISGPDASEWYQPFASVHIQLNKDNCLVIDAPLVSSGQLETNDIAEVAVKGASDGKHSVTYFRIKGRKDNVICSGGIKIQIEEAERMLKPYLSEPFMIVKNKNEKFGEIAVIITQNPNLEKVRDICVQHLPQYWAPREYMFMNKLPLTETGKPRRSVLLDKHLKVAE